MAEHPKHPLQDKVTKQLCHVVRTVRCALPPGSAAEEQTVRRAPIAEGIAKEQLMRRAPIASGRLGERTAPQPMQQSPLAQGISPVYIDRRQYHFTIGNLEEFVKIQQRMEMERQSLRMGYLPRIK